MGLTGLACGDCSVAATVAAEPAAYIPVFTVALTLKPLAKVYHRPPSGGQRFLSRQDDVHRKTLKPVASCLVQYQSLRQTLSWIRINQMIKSHT